MPPTRTPARSLQLAPTAPPTVLVDLYRSQRLAAEPSPRRMRSVAGLLLLFLLPSQSPRVACRRPPDAPGKQIPVIPVSFLDSDLLHLLELGARPLLVIYKYIQELALRAPSRIASLQVILQKQFVFQETLFQMEICSRAGIVSLWGLAIHPKTLRSLVFRVLPKLLGLPLSLLKKFRKDEHAHPPLMETAVGTLPELPQDILMDIFATLEIPDLVRSGSVCSSWRSAYTSLRNLGKYKQSQTPCLLYTSESAGENVVCLYSLVEKRSYKLTLPEPPIRSRFLIGSSLGWLVTVDEISQMHLVNPITREQIALPSVITIEQVKLIFNDSDAVHKYEYSWYTGTRAPYTPPPSIFALGELRDYLHHKAFVFSDTSTGSYIVVLIHNPFSQLSFARIGDDKWTWLPPHRYYEDCIYKDGLLYAVTSMGEIHAFDLSGAVVTVKMIMGKAQNLLCQSMYIVQAPWGDLLQVWRSEEDEEEHLEADPATFVRNTGEIIVYKVDTLVKTLVEINSLHDHVLFLGHNQSLCLSAEEYPSLKANHAYFTDDHDLWILGFKNNRRDVGVFDLDNNSREELVSPQLWSNWPVPMWLTPNLTKMNGH